MALAEHMRRRLGFVLTRHRDRTWRVTVRDGDENRPCGGVEKYCRIQVRLHDAPVVVVKDGGPDLYATIDRAAEHIAHVVGKYLDHTQPDHRVAPHGMRLARHRGAAPASDRAEGRLT